MSTNSTTGSSHASSDNSQAHTKPSRREKERKFKRLSGPDYTMQIMEKAGFHAQMQSVVKTSDHITRESLDKLADRIYNSTLTRRIHKVRFPFARDVWVAVDKVPEARLHPQVLDPSEVDTWLQGHAHKKFDLYKEVGYEINAAHISDGTSILSTVVNHVITDGHGFTNAIINDPHGRELFTSEVPSLKDNFLDAFHYGRTVAWPFLTGYATTALHKAATVVLRKKEIIDYTPITIIQIPSDKVRSVAKEHGGTATGVLEAITVNTAGNIRNGSILPKLLMMVDIRNTVADSEEAFTNALGYADIKISGMSYPVTDLVTLRHESKEAYKTAKLRPAPGRMVMLSNIGEVPQEVMELIPNMTLCAGMAVPYVDGLVVLPLRSYLTIFVSEYNGVFSMASFGYLGVGKKELVKAISEECDRWGIPASQVL